MKRQRLDLWCASGDTCTGGGPIKVTSSACLQVTRRYWLVAPADKYPGRRCPGLDGPAERRAQRRERCHAWKPQWSLADVVDGGIGSRRNGSAGREPVPFRVN